ncbi:MAG TPA: S8 family serine peptidase, partial [Candidatus Eisenbacteria bacterium]|nr:S8 family serine peptidase [Candidatus Eisenbacteria bacterium]
MSRGKAEWIARSQGATLAEEVTPEGLVKVRFDGPVFDAVARWKARSDVLYAVPNVVVHGFFVPNDSTIATYDLAWNLRQFDAFSAWDVVTGSPDVVVAIVDGGVAFEDHVAPEYEKKGLWPRVTMYRQSPDLPGPFVPGWDFVNDDAHPNDDNGHGTSVATIAAGAANNRAGSAGIAFGVTILPVKVLNYRNDATFDDIVQGIRFAAEQGADVINLSLGLPPMRLLRALGYPEAVLADIVKPFRDAVFFAQRRGAIVVAASGNFGATEVSYPAGLPGVIAVGATGVTNRPAGYSSYGSHLDFMAPGGDFLDENQDHIQDAVAVMSIKPHRSEGSLAKPDSFNVFFFFGTSGAAPHVSGAVALLLSLGVRDQGQIEQALRATSVNEFQSRKGFDPTYGSGLIQVGKAVRYAAARHGGHLAFRANGDGVSRAGPLEARLLSTNPARGST